MTADAAGNDLESVGVPITGLAAVAPVDVANVIAKADLSKSPLVLPVAAKRLGLFKQDGGPAETRDSSDPLEFFQAGYLIAGDGKRTVQIGVAEDNPIVLQVTEGAEPDVNGVIEVSSSLPDNRWILYVITKYRNGKEKRREGVAAVTAVEPDQEERGTVNGKKLTFTWQEDDLFNGAPFWQWGPAAPTVAGP